jgi:hypothetical protein
MLSRACVRGWPARPWAAVLVLFILVSLSAGIAHSLDTGQQPVVASADSGSTPLIVVGFVGGFVRHDDFRHSEVQLAQKLRDAHSDHLRIAIFGNWHRKAAVLLTVQVDSIAKPGQDDRVVPANVARAANFYQTRGLLHGHSRITAADPAQTDILGDFFSDYPETPAECSQYPLVDPASLPGAHRHRVRPAGLVSDRGLIDKYWFAGPASVACVEANRSQFLFK